MCKASSVVYIFQGVTSTMLCVLRVLGTNSLFMSLPVAMDSISKTRAARRTQFVAVQLEWRRELANQILELQLTCCESGAPTAIAQIASTFFDKTLKCSYLSSPNLFSRVNSVQGRA